MLPMLRSAQRVSSAPEQEAGVDADGVESFGELAADAVGLLAVGREADDADGSAGPCVA